MLPASLGLSDTPGQPSLPPLGHSPMLELGGLSPRLPLRRGPFLGCGKGW